MKRYTHLLLLLATAVASVPFSSCLSDDDAEYDDYCYISGFTLGSLKRTMFTISSEGEDSVYSTTLSGSLFPMTIDQRALTIENQDSLPLHTRVDAVLATVTYDGILVWRKAGVEAEEGEDIVWTSYDSSDSIDFTEPLLFACFASDGLSYRTYTVNVNVHQQKGDSTVWNEVGEAEALGGMGARKALCLGGQITILGDDGSGSLSCVKHPMGTGGDWVAYSTTGTAGADVATLQRQGNALFLSDESGQVLSSENAVDWTVASFPQEEGLRLVGASDVRLYALLGDRLVSSDGGDWTTESLDEDGSYLPSEQVYSFYYQLPDGQERLMMVGERGNSDDTSCMVWAKAWRDEEETQSTWMFYTPNGTDKYRCPTRDNLNVVEYDGGFLSFGGACRDGSREAMDSVLYSQDHGITWKPYDNDDMEVAPLIRETARDASYIVSAVDEDNYLWVIVDKTAWRGRINRLGFLRQDP